jgi:hypothetical protein
MSDKLWKFVYVDSIFVDYVEIMGNTERIVTASNRALFKNCPIKYRSDDGTCFIFSDTEILGLERICENISFIDERLDDVEFGALYDNSISR